MKIFSFCWLLVFLSIFYSKNKMLILFALFEGKYDWNLNV